MMVTIKKSADLNIIGVIPARMGSSRFPGKPLAKILDIPMVGHVYFRSKMNETLKEIYVATCDQEIGDYADSIGAQWVMTKDIYERPSERVAEAVIKIEEKTGKKLDIAVMIQGDEPMVHPQMIDQSIEPMIEDSSIGVVNLTAPIKTIEEHNDPNCVKVVLDKKGFAIYFSREPIPSRKKGAKEVPMFKQVCIIPFRRDFLLKYNELESTPLEQIESIDMLRVLEHGYKVKMAPTDFQTHAVDTPQDLQHVEELMKDDPLISQYKNS